MGKGEKTTVKTAGIAVGLKKGHLVTKRKLPARPSRKKGVRGKRTKLVVETIREVTGFAPYEKRVLELIRNGLEKRALKYAKKKLGTHKRGKRKFSELTNVYQKSKRREDH